MLSCFLPSQAGAPQRAEVVLFSSFEDGVSFFPQWEIKNYSKLFMKHSCVKTVVYRERSDSHSSRLKTPLSTAEMAETSKHQQIASASVQLHFEKTFFLPGPL